MLKSTGAIGFATLLSRILGMVREIVYASFMGAGPVAGAFKMALMIPNLFRRLLGEGALTAAFIPIFKEKERNEGEAQMWRAANSVLCGLLVAAGVITLLVIAVISIVLHGDYLWLKDETRLMLRLTQIMFPYMLLVCAAAVLMGMLNARGHFFVPAMGSCLLNLVLIATVLGVVPFFGSNLETQIIILAIGVLVAGVAQAIYQMPTLLKEGFRFQWVSPFHNDVIRTVVSKMIPGMMGVAAFQLNVLITQSIAFFTGPEVVASFDYAVRLMEFPQGIFAISLATYLLPTLSGLAAEKKYPEFRQTFRDALGYLVFINLLASILLCVLAKPMVRLLFEHGKFGPLATEKASFALMCLAPGLVLFSIVNITARAFYALGDTSIPMKISSVCLGLNVVFALFLIPAYKEGGMGAANTLSAAFNVYLLLYGLRRKLKQLQVGELPSWIARMLAVGFTAGVTAWLTSFYWENWIGHAHIPARLGGVFIPAAAATLVYFALLAWLKVPQVYDVVGMFTQKLRARAKPPENT